MNHPLYRNPFLQVGCAIAAGAVLGILDPALAVQMKPLGDLFIRAIRWLIGPVIFFTVAAAIPALRGMGGFGRVGLKTLLCFEALSLLSLAAGLIAGNLLQPGVAFRLDAAVTALPVPLDTTHALPVLLARALARSSILQMLAAALICGSVLALLGPRGALVAGICERASAWLLKIVGIVLKAAPLAAFGAIAYTFGRYGPGSVAPLLKLLGALYLSMTLYVLVVLGLLARLCGFSILRFIGYIKEELGIVFGTSSSIAAMPTLMAKLEQAGCPKALIAVVLPAGYSFNLNGTGIYLTLTLLFLAQAFGIDLDLWQQLTLFAVAAVTSKGASGVAGSAFVALAATLTALPELPEAGLLYIVGIERLLKCRALANIIGNGVACIAIAAWERVLDRDLLRTQLGCLPDGRLERYAAASCSQECGEIHTPSRTIDISQTEQR